MVLWPVVWAFSVFVMLCCLNGARPVGQARFRWLSGWLVLVWYFFVLMYPLSINSRCGGNVWVVRGFMVCFVCWARPVGRALFRWLSFFILLFGGLFKRDGVGGFIFRYIVLGFVLPRVYIIFVCLFGF